MPADELLGIIEEVAVLAETDPEAAKGLAEIRRLGAEAMARAGIEPPPGTFFAFAPSAA